MAPRSTAQRRADTLALLAAERDCWVATADRDGKPHLVPLSFWWDGETLIMATEHTSRTGRNLAAGGGIRLAVGPTRDLVMIDGTVVAVPMEDGGSRADGFAEAHSWDPRGESGDWTFLVVTPTRVQAWREADEIAGRTIMRGGFWLE